MSEPTRGAATSAAEQLDGLRAEAASCTNCGLYERATQTVFGEGPPEARILLIGEQPGDQEDKQGHPFVGPAGRVLSDALEAAGIDRTKVYVTNAVKHFKWVPRGKKRIHQKPTTREIRACHPWLEREIGTVKPDIVVCLGATAAQALLGSGFRLTQHRGMPIESSHAAAVIATIHPSSVLRQRDSESRQSAFSGLVNDLTVVASLAKRG